MRFLFEGVTESLLTGTMTSECGSLTGSLPDFTPVSRAFKIGTLPLLEYKLDAHKIMILKRMAMRIDFHMSIFDFFGMPFILFLVKYNNSSTVQSILTDSAWMVLSSSVTDHNDTEEETKDLGLTPALLEEALNLLLVNKTVTSCVMILQSRRPEKEKMNEKEEDESTEVEQNTVIHVTPTVSTLVVTVYTLIIRCPKGTLFACCVQMKGHSCLKKERRIGEEKRGTLSIPLCPFRCCAVKTENFGPYLAAAILNLCDVYRHVTWLFKMAPPRCRLTQASFLFKSTELTNIYSMNGPFT